MYGGGNEGVSVWGGGNGRGELCMEEGMKG